LVTGHAGLIHAFNKSIVLQAVRRLQPVSRSSLARETGLTSATVSNLIQDLIQEGFVIESYPGRSKGGRRPMLIELDDRNHFFLGLEIGVRHSTVVLVDLKARIRVRDTMLTPVEAKGDAPVAPLAGLCNRALQKAGVEPRQVVQLGVTIPGVWDAAAECIEMIPNLPHWQGLPLGRLMAKATSIGTKVENDANAASLAEKWFGAGRGLSNIIYILWDVGIGAGIVLGGRLWNGRGFGEIGHLTVDPDGPACGCGNRGCLEAMASLAVIERELGNRAPESPHGQAVLHRAADYLGTALAGLINIFAPETIIVGGPAARKYPSLCARAFDTARRRALATHTARVQLRKSLLEVDVCALGAAAMVMEDVFQPLRVQMAQEDFFAKEVMGSAEGVVPMNPLYGQ